MKTDTRKRALQVSQVASRAISRRVQEHFALTCDRPTMAKLELDVEKIIFTTIELSSLVE